MKLATFKTENTRTFGTVENDGVILLPDLLKGQPTSLMEILKTNSLKEIEQAIRGKSFDYPLEKVTFDIPIHNPEKIFCVGQNYRAHIKEMGYEIPNSPSIFSRYARTFVPHEGTISMPTHSDQLDYEGELTVVIGRPARNVMEEEALNYVIGYTICNDGSVRDWQKRGPQVAPGKNWEKSGMLGPWITTSDAAADPTDMTLITRINGEIRQQSNTGDMVFSVANLVSYISTFITLMPGDMITTGSPSGVAAGFSPPKWLQPGDKVEIEIESIGKLAATVA